MSVHGKKTLLSTITAVVCIVLYAAAIAWGAGRILRDSSERTILAAREFTDIHDSVSSVSAVHGFMTQAYQEAIQEILLDSRTILGIIITGSGAVGDFERQPGTIIERDGNTLRFKTGFGISGDPYYRAVQIEGQRNSTVQAVYSYIDYDLFIRVLKETLIIIFAVMALAVFILLLDINLKSLSASTAADTSAEAPYSETGTSFSGASSEDGFDASSDDAADEEAADTEADDYAAPDFDEAEFPGSSAPSDDAAGADEASGTDDFSAPGFDGDDAGDESGAADQKPSYPKGLYSPKGIGWESYTKERLESELHRCASLEEDLVFIELKAGTNTCDEDQFAKLVTECAGFFTLRDMIFESGDRGLALIVPALTVDQGFAKSEEFQNRVRERLADSSGAAPELYIGLSSRAGRLVEAERLMMETAEALSRALSDPDAHIVAFKSDPEKYRDFIKSRA